MLRFFLNPSLPSNVSVEDFRIERLGQRRRHRRRPRHHVLVRAHPVHLRVRREERVVERRAAAKEFEDEERVLVLDRFELRREEGPFVLKVDDRRELEHERPAQRLDQRHVRLGAGEVRLEERQRVCGDDELVRRQEGLNDPLALARLAHQLGRSRRDPLVQSPSASGIQDEIQCGFRLGGRVEEKRVARFGVEV